ncbi:MAG: efflux RND transporter permease subunit [Chromatiales bacterium]|nr:efflux RND transporter permease subunit [Chromatiales bacterium]
MAETPMGLSGRIARQFLTTQITPLLALVGLLLGAFAIAITPREEEPQINVTFANIFVPFPGASAKEVEELLATPGEQVLSEIKGIEHVFSTSRAGLVVFTVQFKVGEDRTSALVRLYNKIVSNQDWLPQGLGVGEPLIKPKGIDDVPMITATLWTRDATRGNRDLLAVAHALEAELKRVPGTRDIYTIGGPPRVIQVALDPARLAGYGIAVNDLRNALAGANFSVDTTSVTVADHEILIKAGELISSVDEVAALVVGVFEGRPVFLEDVATVHEGTDDPNAYVRFGTGPASELFGIPADVGTQPAVTLVVAKKEGENAVKVAKRIIDRIEQLEGLFIPEGIEVTITRDYGATADYKASKLIQKLSFATLSVVLLVLFAMGWREAIVVGFAIIVTLAATLFASWAWGFTLNRVSLFALIFSIGILVDDAIVVVENVHRHLALGARNLVEMIPRAVDEVGGPTILATFTVIAALLPMAFVTGLMGPYMSPIPINASMGMLLSLAVAFVITPWLANRLIKAGGHGGHAHEEEAAPAWLVRLFEKRVGPFLDPDHGQKRRRKLFMVIVVLIIAASSLALVKLVILKMLPFDNKSEVQIVFDMPEGASLETTARLQDAVSAELRQIREVAHFQIYTGTASPIGFNGLVRQYYLRRGANVGDIQVTLVDKHDRDRTSHEIAREIRERVTPLAVDGASIKVVEVPPGPPVMAPLVAEIYGLDYDGQMQVAGIVRGVFEQTPDIVDVDDSIEAPQPRGVVIVDRERAARLGVTQTQIARAVQTVLGGEDIGFLHGENIKYAVPIRLAFSIEDKASMDTFLALKVRANDGSLVPLSEVVTVRRSIREQSIHHKDGLPVVYVTGDMSGETDSPLYGMFEIFSKLRQTPVQTGAPLEQSFFGQPANPYRYGMKWDGEWQVTYETFRDMGIAYAVGMLLIYLLVVAQFRSYLVPVIIMVPIPLTVIGVMPAHALLGAQFTATSMIGMIGLAGIIVRNSILLVDFINEQVRAGVAFEKAVLRSGIVRTKPIVLTGAAAMLGAFFILDDPIFQGLAISLISGIFVSTILTLVVIPVMYYAFMRNQVERIRNAA